VPKRMGEVLDQVLDHGGLSFALAPAAQFW